MAMHPVFTWFLFYNFFHVLYIIPCVSNHEWHRYQPANETLDFKNYQITLSLPTVSKYRPASAIHKYSICSINVIVQMNEQCGNTKL
jgi:hypothetical protein